MYSNESGTGLICDLFPDERPYEKCRRFGAGALTDAELLAVILRTGTKGKGALALARAILSASGREDGLDGLFKMRESDLLAIEGVGSVKASQLLCVTELARRLVQADSVKKLDFSSAKSIAAHYMERLRHLDHEELHLLSLDARMQLIRESMISKGGVCCAPVSPREVFREAVSANAVGIVLMHNHPSGDPTPSMMDIELTDRIAQAGSMIGVPLMDHVIIGDRTFCSLNEYMNH